MDNLEVHSGRLDIGGKELNYEVSGSGPTVVLIHAHSVDRRMWDTQFASLASRYQVIRYDAGHFSNMERPEVFTNLLEHFFEEQDQ